MRFSSEQRKRLIARLIVLAIVIAVAALKPKIQAWLNDGTPPGVNTDVTVTGLPAELPDVRFRDPEEANSSGKPTEQQSEISSSEAVGESANTGSASIEPAAVDNDRVKSDQMKDKPAFRTPSQDKDSEPDVEKPQPSGKPSTRPSSSSGPQPSTKSEAPSGLPRPTKPANSKKPAPGVQQKAEKPLGQLTEIRRRVYESTAGLIYLPGSADGHRLDHVMQHAEDDTSKRIHGVFEGDRDAILATIDEAFEKSRKGGRDIRTEDQNGRTVLTVRMSRKIGHMGGEEGQRQRNPECRYLRMVLENGNEVVSAYPTKSF